MGKRKYYKKSQIIKYWFHEGRERLLKNYPLLGECIEWDTPHCFACDRTAIDPEDLKYKCSVPCELGKCNCVKNWDKSRVVLEKCHIIPLALGGLDEISNIVLLCPECHRHNPNINNEELYWLWMKNTESYCIADNRKFHNAITVFEIDQDYFRSHSEAINKIKEELMNDESFYYIMPNALSNHYGTAPVYTGVLCLIKVAIEKHKELQSSSDQLSLF